MKKVKRRSPIWLISKEELQLILDKSTTIGEVLQAFGLINKGNNYKTLQERVVAEELSLDTLKENRRKMQTNVLYNNRPRIPTEDILNNHSGYSRTTSLKERLIKEGYTQNICSICGLSGFWNNMPLSLQLDHINGIKTDNSLENLRLVCPNCHTQTKTFSGRNKNKRHPSQDTGGSTPPSPA